MEKANIFILNISNAANTSGVNRYLDVLLNDLKSYRAVINVYKIELIRDIYLLFPEITEKNGYTDICIPFPLDQNEIIKERYWMRKYNQYVFELIKPFFDISKVSILHLHTLNLIDLALYIKEKIPAKIITHLHCIPWKNYFNTDKKKFKTLYTESYLTTKKILDREAFFTNNCEYDSYAASDKIIAVTHCAKAFLTQTIKISPQKITVIPNGLFDCANSNPIRCNQNKSNVFQCLYVGFLSESKGIYFILDALRKVSKSGKKVMLNVAGSCFPDVKKRIESDYNDVAVNLLGRISFDDLKKQYAQNDVGLIASLQEQCSYVAIEMAMFGLPIVTTAVDGLDEMFEDNVNALKVNTIFSKVFGLRVDTDMMADKITRLIENNYMRIELSKNVRKLYEERFTSTQMIEETIAIYDELKKENI